MEYERLWKRAILGGSATHYLNNQLHLLLDEEEEDPEMFIEDDSWEEEDPSDEDDAISDLDSEHAKE